MHITRTIAINRTPEEVFAFWQDYENYPNFMEEIESVRISGARLLHWRTKDQNGKITEWDTEISIEKPFSEIAFRSVKDSDVDIAASVRIERATGGRGAFVKMEVDYNPPGGIIGEAYVKLFGEDPEKQIYRALRASKQILETGGVVVSDASLHHMKHPARPPEESAEIREHL